MCKICLAVWFQIDLLGKMMLACVTSWNGRDKKRLTTYGIENVGRKNEKYEVKQLVSSVYLYSCSPHCFIGVVEKAWKNVKYGIFRENQFLLKQRKNIQSFAQVHKFSSGSHSCKIGTTTKKGIPKPWIQSKVDVEPVEKPVKLVHNDHHKIKQKMWHHCQT